jgi:gluconate 2-dehydrogenase gamma chain
MNQVSVTDKYMSRISRRELLASLAGLAISANPRARATNATHSEHDLRKKEATGKSGSAEPELEQGEVQYLFFNREEAQFIEAAVARLIPTDEHPGAIEAWVPNYLDKQLGGAWGSGERLYRNGPWEPTRPGLGYQLPLTPGELFHTAIKAINAQLSKTGQAFWELPVDQQDAFLHKLEAGDIDLNGVPSEIFFDQLVGMTIEGFFSDPIYGGNKNMVGWKMIRFPGAYASYYDLIDKHGIRFDREPISLGQGGGHFMPNPNIPAESPHQ